MKSLNFDDSIKKLNTLFNDKELNELYEKLNSLIEVINSKPELSPKLSLLKELHENSPLKDLNPLINNEKIKFLHERLETTTKKVSTNPSLKLNIKLFFQFVLLKLHFLDNPIAIILLQQLLLIAF